MSSTSSPLSSVTTASAAPQGFRARSTAIRRVCVGALVVTYCVLISGLPVLVAGGLVLITPSSRTRALALVLSPVAYALAYILTSGLLSRLSRSAIVAGKVPRDLGHAIYGPRRLYALCWTAIYYFPPLYHAILAVPALKWVTFRLFGYTGTLRFVVYPDTWLRDLPLLHIGPGAYLANRATIGTNICLRSGDLIVNRIVIGARSMVGHLAVIGLGGTLGADVEIGVGTTVGVDVTIGDRTKVGAIVGINNGAQIGSDCDIESMSYIGRKAVIADGIRVRAASIIPDRALIRTQQDADRCVPSQSTLDIQRARGVVAKGRARAVDLSADSAFTSREDRPTHRVPGEVRVG